MKFKISTYIKELFLFLLLVAATLLVLIATHKASHTRTIVINEVCSNDFSLVENSAGKYADYIELYNAGDTTISLLNWTLHTGKKDSGTYTFGDIRLLPQARVLLIQHPTQTLPVLPSPRRIAFLWKSHALSPKMETRSICAIPPIKQPTT